MVRVSRSFQFGAEMEVYAEFDRIRCRILHAGVEVSLQSCEKMKGEYRTRTQCLDSNHEFQLSVCFFVMKYVLSGLQWKWTVSENKRQ